MRIRTLAAGATTVVAVAAAGLVATASPAAAATDLSLYWNQNYAGTVFFTTVSNSNLDRVFQAGDEASSVDNTTGVAWVLYDDAGYSDRQYCIKPGQRIGNLHNAKWKFGDKISSVKRLGTSSCSGYPQF